MSRNTHRRKRSAWSGVMRPGEVVKVAMAVLRAMMPRCGLCEARR